MQRDDGALDYVNGSISSLLRMKDDMDCVAPWLACPGILLNRSWIIVCLKSSFQNV